LRAISSPLDGECLRLAGHEPEPAAAKDDPRRLPSGDSGSLAAAATWPRSLNLSPPSGEDQGFSRMPPAWPRILTDSTASVEDAAARQRACRTVLGQVRLCLLGFCGVNKRTCPPYLSLDSKCVHPTAPGGIGVAKAKYARPVRQQFVAGEFGTAQESVSLLTSQPTPACSSGRWISLED
jgi:hypothetical protein